MIESETGLGYAFQRKPAPSSQAFAHTSDKCPPRRSFVKEKRFIMTAEINGATRLCCLFGDPVAHSKSPQLHNRAFERAGLNYKYMAFQVPGERMKEAADAIRLLNMRGCNFTMPNKISIVPYLDKLDPAAEIVGSVNTVVNDNGVLTGYITDGYGFMKAFAINGVDVKGKKMVQMGMGGAGTAIAAQAALDGVREIAVFSPSTGKSWNRVAEEVAVIAERTDCKISRHDANDLDDLRHELADADLLANTTPIGMGKLEGQSPIPDASYLRPGLVIQDAIYQPAETELLKMGKEAGCTTINGEGMLFFQGARAWEIWTGIDFPLSPDEM